MKLSHRVGLPFPAVGVLYVVAYILLDMAGNSLSVERFDITAWHPSVGLTFLLVLIQGRSAFPLVLIASFVAPLTGQGDLWLASIEAAVIGSGYVLAALALRRPELDFDPALGSVRQVFLLMVAVIGGSAIISTAFVTTLLAAGLVEAAEFGSTALRYWVGDMVGIATVTPFGLVTLARRRFIKPDWQAAFQVAIIVFVLAVAVGSAEKERLQLFFLLFLPITWIAVSSGVEGVSMALLVTQIGLIAALHFLPGPAIDVTALQARMMVLAVTGLVSGGLVAEARRAEQKLRENQAAIAQLSRLGSMGELAIAIAHEVNQPLSAAGTYSRLVTESLGAETLKDPSIVGTAKKATAQVERAAAVIKRLRALVRLGRSELSPIDIDLLMRESLDLVRPILERGTISVSVEMEKDLPPVMVDRIQIEQVLLNLLRNSAEAIASVGAEDRRIILHAEQVSPQLARIRVDDTGPGFPAEVIGATPTLFSSDKADGLGVGLSVCRSIVEAHGGALRLGAGEVGASVSFTLPFAEVTT